jgi:Uma2 family endonuclease
MVRGMNTVIDWPWTTDAFLAWEDRREGKYEFDGRDIVPMTGGTLAHQRMVFKLCVVLMRLLEGHALTAAREMRPRIGARVRYPDVAVFAGPLDQTTRTLIDAQAIFEVLSDDTATTDRVDKLIDYAAVPSLRCYVLLEQTAVAATLFQREPDGVWIASAHTSGDLTLPGLDIAMPLAVPYRGCRSPPDVRDRQRPSRLVSAADPSAHPTAVRFSSPRLPVG